MKKVHFVVLFMLLVTLSAFCAAPKIETIGAFSGNAPGAVKAGLTETGYRVTGEDGKILAEIWPAKTIAVGQSASSSALYGEFVSGGFYGVITLPNGTGDFRGQKIPAGTYTMRYQLLPEDGNHMGVAPNPDFFLLVPVDADPGPEAKMAYAALVRASAKASGTAHPAAFALESPDARGVAAKLMQGHTIACFPVGSGALKVPIGMILSGSAE
jgi:hypothetical protein